MTLLNRLLLAAGLLTTCPVLQAVDIGNGKALHDENCTRCHQPDIYTREKRMVNSFTELQEQVRQCELMAELVWFDEEIEDVTAYLNDSYYRFKIEK